MGRERAQLGRDHARPRGTGRRRFHADAELGDGEAVLSIQRDELEDDRRPWCSTILLGVKSNLLALIVTTRSPRATATPKTLLSATRIVASMPKYVGVWRYKEHQWVEVPGENRRVPRPRDRSEVLEQARPDLRIID
jgi:hypothetical protein